MFLGPESESGVLNFLIPDSESVLKSSTKNKDYTSVVNAIASVVADTKCAPCTCRCLASFFVRSLLPLCIGPRLALGW